MSKGYVIVASGKEHLQQAYLCALSIKKTQTINQVCLITESHVPKKYNDVFDYIQPIPWHKTQDFYVTQDRWKVYHVTPFKETIVLDSDMIFLSNQDHVWKHMEMHKFDICFPSHVINYRQNKVTNNYYRKVFVENKIPLVYCAQHYFKKSEVAYNYYKVLEMICKEYEEFYKIYTKKFKPNVPSMDLNHALAILQTNTTKCFSHVLNFTHMKPKVQDWESCSNNWMDDIPFYLDDDLQLKIGNYKQTGLFHYVEDKFCKQVVGKYNV